MKKIILIALSLPFLSACSPSMLKMPELPTLIDTSESQPSETDTLKLPNFADLLPDMPEFPNLSNLLPDMPEIGTHS